MPTQSDLEITPQAIADLAKCLSNGKPPREEQLNCACGLLELEKSGLASINREGKTLTLNSGELFAFTNAGLQRLT